MIEPSQGSSTSLSAQVGRDFFVWRCSPGGVREPFYVCSSLLCYQHASRMQPGPRSWAPGSTIPMHSGGVPRLHVMYLAVQVPVVG